MRKSIAGYVTLTITICILVYVSFSSNETIDLSKYSTAGLELNYTVSQDESIDNSVLASNELKKADIPYLGKSFVGFKEALAFKESRGNYFVVNTLGYLGKYQFGRGTLKLIGINNPALFLKRIRFDLVIFSACIASRIKNAMLLICSFILNIPLKPHAMNLMK